MLAELEREWLKINDDERDADEIDEFDGADGGGGDDDARRGGGGGAAVLPGEI